MPSTKLFYRSGRLTQKEYLMCLCVLLNLVTIVGPNETMSFGSNKCITASISIMCKGLSGKPIFTGNELQIEVVYLIESDLRTLISQDLSPLQNLRNLYIKSSLINVMSKESLLDKLENLEILDVAHSSVGNYFSNLFVNNYKIKELSLKGNNITSLSNEAFLYLQRIESIDVSDNEITDVERGAFSSLPALKELNLAHNRIGEHFDPSYLPREPGEKCPEGDRQRCEGNGAVDALWRALGHKGVALFLDGNPVCRKVGQEPVPGEGAAAGRLQFLRDGCVPEGKRAQETEEQAEEGQEDTVEGTTPGAETTTPELVKVRIQDVAPSEAGMQLCLGVVLGLFIALFILAVVLILRRKEKQSTRRNQDMQLYSITLEEGTGLMSDTSV